MWLPSEKEKFQLHIFDKREFYFSIPPFFVPFYLSFSLTVHKLHKI